MNGLVIRQAFLWSIPAMLAVAAHAQCPQGSPAGLVNWSSAASYGATLALADEGITNPPIALTAFASFPMPGVSANLDRLWVNTNGELYLTDSTAGLLEPAGGALYGVNTLGEMQAPAGGSPRVVALGSDLRNSSVTGSNWSVTVDQSVPGEVRVSWVDMSRFGNTTDRFSFACSLFATGMIRFDYGSTMPAGWGGRWVGVSIGNAEPTSGSMDLSALPTSPATESILFQEFANAADWDLSDQSVLIVPDLTPGVETYSVVAVTSNLSACARNAEYGTGCPTITSSIYQLFAGSPAAKAALDGNALQFTNTGGGYTVNWLPGVATALFVPPSATATPTGLATDDATTTITTSPVPTPYGPVSTWTVSTNGILTAGTPGNNGTSYVPSGADMTGAAAPNLAWYMWRDYNPGEAGSGPIVYEEVGGVLYVTWNDVEALGAPSPNRATFQWQFNLATGDVFEIFVSCETSTSTSNTLVGCTLPGAGPDPGSSDLATALPASIAAGYERLKLTASPAPIINPSTLVTFTETNIVPFAPASGVYLSTMFLSLNPLPGGFDLFGILTSTPGCKAYIGSLDLDLGAQVTLAPVATWNVNFSNVYFAPGNVVAAQAVSLFDPSSPLPNGESGGFLLSNGVLSVTHLQ